MGDAGANGGNGVNGEYDGYGDIAEPSPDLGYGAEFSGGYDVDVDWGLGEFEVSEEVGRGFDPRDLTGPVSTTGGHDPVPPPEVPEKPKVPEEPPAKEKKPIITRAKKRRRSLLTEEEGGVLRKPTVYRRSILGRP